MDPGSNVKPHIADYLRPLRSHKWLILVAVVLGTVGTYLYASRQPNVFSSSALVYVNPNPPNPVTNQQNVDTTDRDVADEATLLDSSETAAVVAKQIGYPGTPTQLLKLITVTLRTGEDFIEIDSTGATAHQAADVANGFAQTFVNSINGVENGQITEALNAARRQLAGIPVTDATAVSRQTIADQIRQLEVYEQVPQLITRQVDRAGVPGAATTPRPKRDAIFALVISLLLAIFAVYSLDRFDRRLRRPEDFETAYGDTTVLSVLPSVRDATPVVAGEPALSSELREAFAVLRVNIELASLDRAPRTIVVSSAVSGEGKSTVVRNLALAFRESGRRVAVVDCDLRHPTQGKAFGMEPGPGLTEILRREVSLADAAQDIGVSVSGLDEMYKLNGANGNGVAATLTPSATTHGAVTVIRAGARPANPAMVLGSDRLRTVIDSLLESHDLVLLDSAPLLDVTDTVPLLRYADATLIVGRVAYTSQDTAKRLQDFLGRVPDVNVLGVIANDLPQYDAGSYGYGYGYGYGEPEADQSLTARLRRAAKVG